MTFSSRAPTDGDAVTARQPPGRAVTWPVRVVGYLVAVWCLGFAAVSGWQLVTGPEPGDPFAAYAGGIAAMIILVGVLKLLGAVIALLAIRSQTLPMSPGLLAIGLWGAFGLLAVYSAGSIAVAIGNMTGLTEPTAAWESAGGVTPLSILYVLFFLAGAILFGVLAASFHRRHKVPWTAAVIGLLGAPLLLSVVLVIAPSILSHLDLLPS